MLILGNTRKKRTCNSHVKITNKRLKIPGVPSYSDLLQFNEREGIYVRNETQEVKETSIRNEREGEGIEKEACPLTGEKEVPGVPSYSDLLQFNEREGIYVRNETQEVKETSIRNEREGEGIEKEACPLTGEKEVPGVPSYSDLLQFNEREGICVRNETQEVKETSIRNEREGEGKEKEACPLSSEKENHNCVIEINQNDNEENVFLNTLLELFIKSEEKNKKFLKENRELLKINQQLNEQVQTLQTSVIQHEEIQTNLRKEANTAINALSKICTPGQIRRLTSPHNVRTKWSSEDIVSAIALRSLSPKAYRYLRNVKKVPLPCETTLYDWIEVFILAPGILKDVLKIMVDIGNDLTTVEKLTVITFDEIYISNKLDLARKEQKIYGSYKTCHYYM
ncbi:PREDICTED: uncharacterized protein LOC108780084 [Cyphomyrmex costatus]|uniref:uncharacterized protein LOC108780084 n=1 Tax=Cyphomyrmex costatus TaxID=456900 RepID=UPI0008522398|nr:PREDICTED: uncharacterized protein LOC108780084 [Cyphomyrmex costatus]